MREMVDGHKMPLAWWSGKELDGPRAVGCKVVGGITTKALL